MRAGDVENFLQADAAFVEQANGFGGVARLREETAQHLEPFTFVGDTFLSNILAAFR